MDFSKIREEIEGEFMNVNLKEFAHHLIDTIEYASNSTSNLFNEYEIERYDAVELSHMIDRAKSILKSFICE